MTGRQRVDEAVNKGLDERGVWQTEPRSRLAWEWLSDPDAFPSLATLVSYGRLEAEELDKAESEPLSAQFLEPIWIAADLLRVTDERADEAALARIEENRETRKRIRSD